MLSCLSRLEQPIHASTLQQLLACYVDVAHSSSCQATAIVLCVLAKLEVQPEPAMLDGLLQSLVKSCQSGIGPTAGLGSLQGPGQLLWPAQLAGGGYPPAGAGCQEAAWVRPLAQTAWALARLQQPALASKWLLPLLHLLRVSHSSSCGGGAERLSVLQMQDGGAVLGRLPAWAAWVGGDAATAAAAACHTCAVTLWACARILHAPADTCSDGEQQQPLQPWSGLQQPEQRDQQQQQQRHQQQRFQTAVVQEAILLLRAFEQQLDGVEPQSACMLLWAVNRLRITPDESWCQRFYAAALRISDQLSPSQCSALLCGVAALPVRPPAALAARCLAVLGSHMHQLPATQLGLVLRACARLRMRPPAAWVSALLVSFLAPHQQRTPAAVSTVVHASSRVGFRPAAATAAQLCQEVEQHAACFR